MTPGIDTLAFHERAVRTPSHESPDAMRDLLVGTLREAGHEPTVDAAGNVVATRTGPAGGGDAHHLVLNTHLDTVPPHVPCERDGDLVRGRGACDAKGPLAALLAAFCRATLDDGRLTLAVTPDEETTSAGAAHLVSGGDGSRDGPAVTDADAFIVGEPTDLDVCTAARGRFEGTVTVRGANAHAAEPDAGTNAVAALEPVLGALRGFDDVHGPGTHPALGGPTLQPTVVHGGDAVNQLPDEAVLRIDRRSVPPETAGGFERALDGHLTAALGDHDASTGFALTDRETPFLEAFATDPDERVVAALRAAGAGAPRPFAAATEASYFADVAPTVVFGPGVLADEAGAVAHGPREYVERGAVERAAVVLTQTVESLC